MTAAHAIAAAARATATIAAQTTKMTMPSTLRGFRADCKVSASFLGWHSPCSWKPTVEPNHRNSFQHPEQIRNT